MKKTNAQWMQENGYKFSNIFFEHLDDDEQEAYKVVMNDGKVIGVIEGRLATPTVLRWLDAEHKEQLLNDAEKQYLAAVLEPFKDRFQYVTKERNSCGEWLHFVLTTDSFSLPFFKPGTMYKNMMPHIHYTLEDLGL